MKKVPAVLLLFFAFAFAAATLSGCAALWITGAAVAGVTAYDVITHRECPHCKKVISRDVSLCPYCDREVAPEAPQAKTVSPSTAAIKKDRPENTN